MGRQVLVLNASYEPLNITTWRRAAVLMIKGKAESLEEDPQFTIRYNTSVPTVIRLRYYIQVPYLDLPVTRKNILQRDNYCCQYCGIRGEKLSVDHVFPRSRGGADTWENVVASCFPCNLRKGNRTPEEASMILNKKPYKPFNKLVFEASRQISIGQHKEWQKYVIGWFK